MARNPMQVEVDAKPHANKQCGAKTRDGDPCLNWAMPNGRCRMHGGKSKAPIKHGIYAFKHHKMLGDKIAKFMAVPVDNLNNELALMRALLDDLLDKLTGSPQPKDRMAIEQLVDSIRRLVDTIAKIRNQTALTGQEVQLLVAGMAAILTKYVPDDRRSDAIAELRGFIRRN